MGLSAWTVLGTVLAISLGVISRLGPMTQTQHYHNFVDKRSFLAVPNFGDVMSNLSFLLSGIFTMIVAFKNPIDSNLVFWFGASQVILALASAFYHLKPNDFGLGVDRLGMSICFALALAVTLADRNCNANVTLPAVLVLLAISCAGPLYWMLTNSKGNGDLRLYGVSQYVFLIGIALALLLYRSKHKSQDWIAWMGFLFFFLSKVPEIMDSDIFVQTEEFMSGHTLKHYVAGASLSLFGVYLLNRRA
jgi:hypothetical protein